MLLSGYQCQDICVDNEDRRECISILHGIESGSDEDDNCVKIEGTYIHCTVHMCT